MIVVIQFAALSFVGKLTAGRADDQMGVLEQACTKEKDDIVGEELSGEDNWG
jgi:hypothetical protein